MPVNVFETENELMVVAAMPGIEAGNVDIEVDDNYLTIRADKRGPGQERHRYLRREWSYGPYERSIELPIEQVLALQPGDVLSLAAPADGGVTLFTDKVPVHRAKPGRSGSRRAVQIVDKVRRPQ